MVTEANTSTRVAVGQVRAYLGRTDLAQVRAVRALVGAVTVSGTTGSRILKQLERDGDLYGVDLDPARYVARPRKEGEAEPVALPGLFSDSVVSVAGQISLGLSVVRTAGGLIKPGDADALRRELDEDHSHPVRVVLALEAGWLGPHRIKVLVDELRAADRDVAVCFADQFDPLDSRSHVAGLQSVLRWASDTGRAVELLRTDLAALPAIVSGAVSAAIGLSTNTRHIPLPIPPSQIEDYLDRQTSPLVLIGPLLAWLRGQHLRGLVPWQGAGITSCGCAQCSSAGADLLRFNVDCTKVPPALSRDAQLHDLHTWNAICRQVLDAADPSAELGTLRAAATRTADELVSTLKVDLPALPAWLRAWT